MAGGGAIYLPSNPTVWDQLGNLAGLWAAKRMGQVDATNQAKDYAKAQFGYDPNSQQGNSLWQQALNTPQSVTPQDVAMTQQPASTSLLSQVLGGAGAQIQQGSAQPAQPAVSVQPTVNALPDRQAVRRATQQGMGQNYINMIKSGTSADVARQAVMQKQQQDEQDQWASAVNQYRDTILEPMRQKIVNDAIFTTDAKGNQVATGYDPAKIKALAPAVAQYNALATRVGLQGLDLTALNNEAALTKPNVKYQTMPNGTLVGVDGNTGAVTDVGNYGKKDMQFAPNGQGFIVGQDGSTKSIGSFGAKNIKVMPDGTAIMTGPDGSTQVIGQYAAPEKTTGTATLQASRIAAISRAHAAWMKNNMGANETSSPYYNQLQAAMTGAQTDNGSVDAHNFDGYTGNKDPVGGYDALVSKVNEAKSQGASNAEIMNKLIALGIKKEYIVNILP